MARRPAAATCSRLSRSATCTATSAPRRCPSITARAHALYKALFGQVEDLIRDKHLLIVPSGPLTQLPFQVLVTAPQRRRGDYRAAAGWRASMPSPCCRPSPR